MIPVLYPALERDFTTNGLGGLPHATSCFVPEERNTVGRYFLEMEYPVTGLHYSDLAPERIILAAPAPGKRPQPFRIERISRPINGIVSIEAPHVSAQLQKITTYGVESGTNIEGQLNTLLWRAGQLGQTTGFWLTTDITREGVTTFNYPEPSSVADILLGKEGSVLDMLGGEYEFDGWHIILHKKRGVDTGLEIRYGVNMTNIDAETDTGELVTAVLPYWKGTSGGTEIVLVGDLCVSGNSSGYAYMRTIPLNVSDQFELQDGETPTTAQITAAGRNFIDNTDRTEIVTSIKVSYAQITSTIGERQIHLCDTVRVVYPDMRLSTTAKVVATKYNVLLERYEEVTIGSIRKTVVDTIADLIKRGG